MRRAGPSIVVAAAASMLLAGCSAAGAAGSGADDGSLQIVATTTQVGDLARQVAGSDASVSQLLQPGQSAHSFDPSASALQELANADVLVINGAGLESWLDGAIGASGFDGQVIDTSADVHTHEGAEHDHAHEGDEAADEHAEGEADDHDHGSVDPHIWSDPHNAIAMVESIEAGLAAADADHADAYSANADASVAQLAELDDWIHAAVDQVPVDQRLLVTNHDTFSYFAEAFEVTVVGSVMPSLDDDAEVSADQIDALVAEIRATGVRAVFSESSINPQLAETIADEAGVEVYSGPDSLYADSLGTADSDGATYIGSQIHNVTLIVESWGATAPEPPADLIQE